ncbi:hypothetical protein HT576_08855 [Haloterrigena sp. SYSU A121-1]|uniref:Uncharacterized protein n=1 Tax=Haloterrigena gelatinilytica TaxID=2741724 RepID=A0A8J8GJH8_9EURY|nr:hypothetical protein [Haloterrigena gelatinilytica]NUB91129.1 hypothetical protein [Haloterrigena gelatinilytica]
MNATTAHSVDSDEYSYRELHDMHRIWRKRLFRDILKQETAVSVREMGERLGILVPRMTKDCTQYGLIRKTLEALIDDGIVNKLTETTPTRYYLRTGVDQPLTREERLFQRWEDALKTENGWFDFEEIEELTASVSPEPVSDSLITPFIAYVNDRDKVWIQKSDHSGVPTYFVKGCESTDRYEHLKERLPAGKHVVDTAVAKGRRPSVTAATVQYVLDEDVTQEEAADLFDTSPVSIRSNRDWVREQLEDTGIEIDHEPEGDS